MSFFCHKIDENVEPTDCEWSSYGPWSPCSATCGDGIRTATRTVVQKETNGGKPCTGSGTKNEQCIDKPCPSMFVRKLYLLISYLTKNDKLPKTTDYFFSPKLGVVEPKDCIWSLWSNWSPCTASCGQGVQKATRTISQQAENNGKECRGSNTKRKNCIDQPCQGMYNKIW